MLFFSLVVSAVLLGAVNVAVLTSQFPKSYVIAMCLGSFAVVCMGIGLPAVMLQAIALIVCVIGWSICSGRPWRFVQCSFAVTVLAYVAIWWMLVRPQWERDEELLALAPVINMAERLSTPPARVRTTKELQAPVADRLRRMESAVDDLDTYVVARTLESVHQDAISRFVNSPGFGVHRGNAMQRSRRLRIIRDMEERKNEIILQPGFRDTSAGAEPSDAPGQAVAADSSLHRLHRESGLDFLNPNRFGWARSRHQVVGFQPHRFSQRPKPEGQYDLQILDLIGLLLHEEPVAYVSEHLPRMDELREAPTRTLDAFEVLALKEIQQGEDLFAKELGGTLRLVGAIRATKQCTACHACERGDLLGAFSYTLKRTE